METFYGDRREKYVALVSPMMIWPIEDNYGRGISATTKEGSNLTVHQIISPFKKISVQKSNNNYFKFGYNYKQTAQFLTIHEFGHSFVNSELDNFKKEIEKLSYLFTDKLKQKMKSKGVQSWHTYVIESFVRLGEIRIAEIQKDKKRANFYRDYHKNKEFFVFLPKLEHKIIEFETNRKKYPMWKDFIPELLTVFENSTSNFVNEKLQ